MRKGWEYKKLGEVCALTMGQSPDGNSINEVNGIEFHQGKTCFGERFLGISPLYSNAPTKLAEAHSVLLCVRAPVGYPNITDRKICIGRGLCALYAKREIDNSFLYYSLLGKQSYFEKNATGSTFKAISSKIVSNTTLSIPPLSTQLAIVSELDKINELIRLKKEQLKDFDNLAQSLFYEMFGDPVENEKGWEVKKLGEICTDITDGDHMPPPKSESGIPFITISDIDKDTRCLNFENTFYVPEDYYNNLKENRKPQKGDLLYTVTGSYGIPVIVKTDKKFCFQRHIALLRPNKEILSTIFLCYWVLSDGVKFMADKVATGIAQKTVGLNSIRKFSCILPPLPLQQLFAQRIEQIEREKSEVQKSIQDLETLLASRMQYWFE